MVVISLWPSGSLLATDVAEELRPALDVFRSVGTSELSLLARVAMVWTRSTAAIVSTVRGLPQYEGVEAVIAILVEMYFRFAWRCGAVRPEDTRGCGEEALSMMTGCAAFGLMSCSRGSEAGKEL